MKYTKNIGIKLKLLGFEHCATGYSGDDVTQEVWVKESIVVAVKHRDKIVHVHIKNTDKANIKSIDQLKQLDKLINQ